VSMWKWIYEIRVILGILTGVFIGIGLDQREEIPEMGWSFIAAGAACFIVMIILLLKGRKRYGVAELASDMETMSANLADFVGERERYDPINRIKMPGPNWDDGRKHEEWEEQTQELLGYSSATMDIYRKRFARKVIHLIEEAQKLGYRDKELDSVYKHPTNKLGIGILSDRMGALSLRMRKEVKKDSD
jgi:hypothetical protein